MLPAQVGESIQQLCLSESAMETSLFSFSISLFPVLPNYKLAGSFASKRGVKKSESTFVVQSGCLDWPLCRKIYVWVHMDMDWAAACPLVFC